MWTLKSFEADYGQVTDARAKALLASGDPTKRKAGETMTALLDRWSRGDYNPLIDHQQFDSMAAAL